MDLSFEDILSSLEKKKLFSFRNREKNTTTSFSYYEVVLLKDITAIQIGVNHNLEKGRKFDLAVYDIIDDSILLFESRDIRNDLKRSYLIPF